MKYSDEFFIGSIISLVEGLEYSQIDVIKHHNVDRILPAEDKLSLFFFNKKTKVRGCNFKHLELFDRVKINKSIYTEIDNKKVMFCTEIEIIDVQKKWDSILKKDKKYSIHHSLENGAVIRPQTIDVDLHKCKPEDYDKLTIALKGKIGKRHRRIIEQYMSGKSYRDLAEIFKCSHITCYRVIKKYLGEK